jgi:hypothetical protein
MRVRAIVVRRALNVACRKQENREASPLVAIIDSQSVKSPEVAGPASIRLAVTRAEDHGKKRTLSDALGLLPADIQDYDDGILLLASLSGRLPAGADDNLSRKARVCLPKRRIVDVRPLTCRAWQTRRSF